MKASGRDAGRDRNTAKWFRLYDCSRAGGQDSGVRHMAEKNENNVLRFLKQYAVRIVAVCGILLVLAYFINIMFVQNQKTAVSVLVLEFMEDTSALEQQVREALGAGEDEKIEIRTISSGIEANKAVALTWIRAEVVDVVIGGETQMTEYAQAGYLKDLSGMKASEQGSEEDGASNFLCGLAQYDQDGNVTGTGPKTCFGRYIPGIPGAQIEQPVAGLADNASNVDNGLRLLQWLGTD